MNETLRDRVFARICSLMKEDGYSEGAAKLSRDFSKSHSVRRGGLMLSRHVGSIFFMIYICESHIPHGLTCFIGRSLEKMAMPARLNLASVEKPILDGLGKSFSIGLFEIQDLRGEPLATFREEQDGWYLIEPEKIDFSSKNDLFEKMLSSQMKAMLDINSLDVTSAEAFYLADHMADRIVKDLKSLAFPYLYNLK